MNILLHLRWRFIQLGFVKRLLVAGVLCLDTILFVALLLNIPEAEIYSQQAFIIDAGSVHTTIVHYEWPSNAYRNGTALVHETGSCEVSATTGISAFAEDPENVNDYLFNKSNCSLAMFNNISDVANVTYLGATGGMRDLNRTNSLAALRLMARIEQVIPNRTRILSALEEGLYGWLTVNYIVYGDQFTPSRGIQVGALDWGGSSAQITFAKDMNGKCGRNLTVFGRDYDVFTRSDDCYGQHEALRRYFFAVVLDRFDENGGRIDLAEPFEAPCQPDTNGTDEYVMFDKEELFYSACVDLERHKVFKEIVQNYTGRIRFEGTNNLSDCRRRIDKLFDVDDCAKYFGRPNCFVKVNMSSVADKPTLFYAFSTFWHTIDRMKLGDKTVANGILAWKNKAAIDTKVKQLCQSPYVSHPYQNLQNMADSAREEAIMNECFRSVFIRVLLTDGYGFTEDTVIEPVDKVNGQSVGWSLGYLLTKSGDFGRSHGSSTMGRFFVLLLFAIVFYTLQIVWCVFDVIRNPVLDNNFVSFD